MASGQQLSDKNYLAFIAWRDGKTDDDFKQMAFRGSLNRKEIANECCFAKSVLTQNPRIAEALRVLEAALRERKVLPQLAASETTNDSPLTHPVGQVRAAADRERLKRLEEENAALRAENAHLKGVLEKYTTLQLALHQTGRVPR